MPKRFQFDANASVTQNSWSAVPLLALTFISVTFPFERGSAVPYFFVFILFFFFWPKRRKRPS
jgi:hypothetical protein